MENMIDISTLGEGPGTRRISGVITEAQIREMPSHALVDSRPYVDLDPRSRPYAETASQPPPKPNDRPAIQDLVTADIAIRKDQGIAKYGTALQPFNGRDALVDSYQEALDLVQYLRQAIYERDGR